MDKKTNSVKISVILPVYNIGSDLLEKCFDSLRGQTFSDAEYLLVDDGSKEEIGEFCRKYAETYPAFRYLCQPHSGVSAARNNGLSHAEGEYVCFVDPDDWVSENYLDVLYELITASGAEIGLADAVVHYDTVSRENHFLNCGRTVLRGTEKNRLLYQCVGKKICGYYPPEIAAGVPWGKIFRRSFLIDEQIRFVPGMPRMQDNIFSLYTYEIASSVAYTPEPVYHYRNMNSSVSHKYNPDIISQFEWYYKETKEFLDRFHKEEILYRALQMKELTSFNSYLTYYFFRKKERSKKEVDGEIGSLLEKEPYRSALRHIDRSLLTGTEYIFVICLKKRLFSLLRVLVFLRNRKKGIA